MESSSSEGGVQPSMCTLGGIIMEEVSELLPIAHDLPPLPFELQRVKESTCLSLSCSSLGSNLEEAISDMV